MKIAKGPLALVTLAVVVVGFGLALAMTPEARVSYWKWRLRSSDVKVRKTARAKLLEIAPAELLPQLVAEEACDRLDGESRDNIFFGVSDFEGPGHDMVHGALPFLIGSGGVSFSEEVRPEAIFGPRLREGAQLVVAVDHPTDGGGTILRVALVYGLPKDESVAASIVSERRTRLVNAR